jgi:hypothetical protein
MEGRNAHPRRRQGIRRDGLGRRQIQVTIQKVSESLMKTQVISLR